MAFWQTSEIQDINIGTAPNDGTGDDIRTAFYKADYNFSNISQFLSSTQVNFLNANISYNLITNYITVANLFVANATGTTARFTSNITGGNLIANVGLYSSGTTNLTTLVVTGQSNFNSNINISGNIIPTVSNSYDLGTVTNPFRNLYVGNTLSTTQTVISSESSLLQIHANASVVDTKDVGIFANVRHGYTANTYAFFGYQYITDNFVYKITETDAVLGNSVVYDGVYGNVQVGSLFLSNSTVSASTGTGALIVAGGAGVGGTITAANITSPAYYGNVVSTVANIVGLSVSGTISNNLTVDGNIFSYGYQVVTTNALGNYGTPYIGGIVSGSQLFLSTTAATLANTGAVVILGGLGVGSGVTGGNIVANGNVIATGHVGSVYGNILTASQPYITGVGSIGNLTVLGTTTTASLNVTSIGVQNITGTGNIYFSTINGLTSLGVTGTTTSNSAAIGSSITTTATSGSISSTAPVVIDTFTATTYTTARYLIQVVDTGYTPARVQASEAIVMHDRNGVSTIPYISEFGIVFNVFNLGNFTTSYSSGQIQLIFTANSTPTNMVVKVVRTSITA